MSSDFYENQNDGDWENILFVSTCMRLYMTFSKNFEKFGSKDIGL